MTLISRSALWSVSMLRLLLYPFELTIFVRGYMPVRKLEQVDTKRKLLLHYDTMIERVRQTEFAHPAIT